MQSIERALLSSSNYDLVCNIAFVKAYLSFIVLSAIKLSRFYKKVIQQQ